MNYKLISCEVFHREMCAAVAVSPHQVDIEFLPKALHDLGGEAMRAHLQEAVDRVDASRYAAILFGYGLCNNGLHGIVTRKLPLVAPRAHDCMTLFFGSKERYLAYFRAHPGTFFKTSGWIERDRADRPLKQLGNPNVMGPGQSYAELVERYGEDNAQYIHETLCRQSPHYTQVTFIEMGVEPDDRFENQARETARDRQWGFDKVRGDRNMFTQLVGGDWPDHVFLVVPPGHRIAAAYDDGIIRAEACEAGVG